MQESRRNPTVEDHQWGGSAPFDRLSQLCPAGMNRQNQEPTSNKSCHTPSGADEAVSTSVMVLTVVVGVVFAGVFSLVEGTKRATLCISTRGVSTRRTASASCLTTMASSSTRTRKTSLGRRPAGFDLGTDAGAGTSAGGSSSRSSARHDYPGTPSSSSARRQALLYGPQEDRVVLDIGTRCTKVGFAGEARPRMVLDSVKTATRASESLPHDGYGREAQDDICLWGPDILHCRDQEERSKRKARLSARLTLLLREVYIT